MTKRPIKTLKNKIFRPFLTVTLMLSILIFFAFNISMRVYMNRMALNEIDSSRDTVKALLRNELASLKENEADKTAQELILAINRSFRLSVATTGTEMAVLGANGNLVLPRESDLTQEMQSIIAQISKKMTLGETTATFSTRTEGMDYLVSYGRYNDTKLMPKAQTLVLVASKEATANLIRRTNVILIFILSITTLIGLIIYNRLANEITKPIKQVSAYVQKLRKGQYDQMDLNVDTEEVFALYENLNTMGETLKVKEQSKIDFIQNFSHDLRTPLMSIQGYAEGIQTGVFEDTTKAASIIAEESVRLTHLIDQIITLSKLDLPDNRLQWSNVELLQFMGILVERYEGYATREHKKVVLVCDKELKAFTSEDLLEKIVSNLVGNAIRYANAQVRIEVRKSDHLIEITVLDDGPGIPENLRASLFKRFAKDDTGQHGLGLSIASAAAEQLGGHLSAHNLDQGAAFVLTLPHRIS